MKKIVILFLSILLYGALIVPAHAFTQNVSFYDTNLGWVEFSTFDWAPGNALADNSVPLSTDPTAQTSFDLLYQASLSSFLDSSGIVAGTGLGTDYEITIVSKQTEQGYFYTDPTGNINSAVFTLDTSAPNYVEIYYDDYTSGVAANALAGTGYGDGTLLMSGIVVDSSGGFNVTLDTDGDGALNIAPIDGHLTDNYVGTGTLKGTGATTSDVEIDTTTVDTNLFSPSGALLLSLDMFFNTSQITPFLQVDPSAQVLGVTPEFGDAVGSWTSVNGLTSTSGPVDFQFQADANSSFTHTVVPEPSGFFLIGFGLLACSGFLRRKGQ